MLRVRTKKGKVVSLDKLFTGDNAVSFIEFMDESGSLAALLQQLPGGSCELIMPGDPKFIKYTRSYKVKSSELVIIKE